MHAIKPEERRWFIGAVGKALTRNHGKRRYYSIEQVRAAALAIGFPEEFNAWGYAFYVPHTEFAAWHAARRETRDYAGLKSEVVADLGGAVADALIDVGTSWLEWPEIDLTGLLE